MAVDSLSKRGISVNKVDKDKLPNLLIIGAMKCGTTSLHHYLGLHPEISMSEVKELYFFVEELNWEKGVQWYQSQFQNFNTKIRGESSPPYTIFPKRKGVPERIHSLLPDVKMIYILRDPIKRIFSQYVHQVNLGLEKRPIREALKSDNDYIYLSKYYMQLEQYLNYFPMSQILIIAAEDLYNHRRETLRKIFQFLGVDDSFFCEGYSTVLHASDRKVRKTLLGNALSLFPKSDLLSSILPSQVKSLLRSMSYNRIKADPLEDEMHQWLMAQIKDDVDRLRQFTGNKFQEWSI